MTDIVERLRAAANGIGSMKTERGDYGLLDEAAAEIERLVAALASLVDRDLTYDGPCIVIPTKNHGEAISLIASARTALEGASDDR